MRTFILKRKVNKSKERDGGQNVTTGVKVSKGKRKIEAKRKTKR